jgi:UDP-N-acetylmuramoylalanine--D-glutamate ligase
MPRALVYGVAIAGKAVLRALLDRGYEVVAADDVVTDDARATAAELSITLHDHPNPEAIDELVAWCDLVAPAPGVPENHAVVVAALRAGKPLRTEIDLAYEWEQQRARGPRPMLAVTGTDGKTTTTLLATEMLLAAGLRAAAVGNTDVPLVEAIADDTLDAFVVECTSFRLSWTTCFRPEAAVWLNLAPDHLNWHADMTSYQEAKARMWKYQRPSDAAIGFVDDPVVMSYLAAAPGRHVTFGLGSGDYQRRGEMLTGPQGAICSVSVMRRSLPHDITNALAASALVLEAGLADRAAIEAALGRFVGPPHRLEVVGTANGVTWYNDSKATTPHAALTAIRAFDSLVLIAGGKNKDLDLSELGSEPQRMRAVVAIGDAADDIAAVFDGICPIERAGSMTDAVEAAARLAREGDAVVLSPACASFDWYPMPGGGYEVRGRDFARLVTAHLATAGAPS